MDRDELNEKHSREPLIGDYWMDHLAPVLCVIEVGKFSVSVLEKKIEVDDFHWTWDITKISTMSRKQFYNSLHYSTANLKHKCWANVVPERDKEFAELAFAKAFL